MSVASQEPVSGRRTLRNLNGWQRLWVVLSIVWLIGVLVEAYSAWPQSDGLTKADVYRRVPPETGRLIADFDDVLSGNDHVEHGLGILVFVGPQMIPLKDETVDDARITRDVLQAQNQVLRLQRLAFIGGAVAFWILPMMALYALGWSIAWIRRGFAQG